MWSPEERDEQFWRRVTKTETCWLWTGAKGRAGYGVAYNGERSEGAHRYAYRNLVGPIPAGLQLDHLCRVRDCVNPEHLEPVTGRDNILRATGLITECPEGHEYTEENTYTHSGKRQCRICRRLRRRERQRRIPRFLTPEQRARKTELQRQRRAEIKAAAETSEQAST